jgi:ABC-type Fe3+-siderophore transport system permease subunit
MLASTLVTFAAIVGSLVACALDVFLVWYAANGRNPWLRVLAGLAALVVLSGLITAMAYAIANPWDRPCSM